MISALMARDAASTGRGYARAATTAGAHTAATIDPSETYRVAATTATKAAAAHATATGARTASTPTAVATPLPPAKCRATGKTWPRKAATPTPAERAGEAPS